MATRRAFGIHHVKTRQPQCLHYRCWQYGIEARCGKASGTVAGYFGEDRSGAQRSYSQAQRHQEIVDIMSLLLWLCCTGKGPSMLCAGPNEH